MKYVVVKMFDGVQEYAAAVAMSALLLEYPLAIVYSLWGAIDRMAWIAREEQSHPSTWAWWCEEREW